ncbi:MAG: GatB/YqeY domain-containing protein [Patescibacteria group bacterium]
MILKQKLTNDMKTAMKARDMDVLQTIRFLLSEIKNVEIDKGEQDDKDIEKIISSQVKKIKEAISEFKRGDRQDLVTKEEKKLEVLAKYLPKQMSQEELEKIVNEVVESNQGLEIGPMIGKVMSKLAGKADGSRVSELVKSRFPAKGGQVQG